MSIEYRLLVAHESERIKEINPARFIKRAWRNIDGTMGWEEINWLDEGYPDGYDNHHAALKATFDGAGLVVGAFDGERMVGFVSVNRDVFGSQFSHVLLDQMFVDNNYQGCGIGKELFRLAVKTVKEWDVDKLYICAGSSEDTLGFYKSLGCIPAVEINQELAEGDENDMQLEYVLRTE